MILPTLHRLFRCTLSCTLRRQLIISIAVVHGVLMSLFIWDLTERQQVMLLEEEAGFAKALSFSIANSAAGWVVARDYYGLQELIDAQRRYPELAFSMILDAKGRVLAHSDLSQLNYYVTDLPQEVAPALLRLDDQRVDVVTPIIVAGLHVGWVRVGLDQDRVKTRLDEVTRDGILYALTAILIGTLIAWFMGTRLTRSLHAIRNCTDAVMNGDLQRRANVESNDEVAYLAKAFNNMLDSVATSQEKLRRSKERFDLAMQASNDGLWDWDLNNDKVYYSPRWKQILGYTDEELENSLETWSRLVDEEGRNAALEMIAQCRRGQRDGFKLNFRMQHKDGHWVDILTQAIMVRDAQGQPQRLVGTHSDISERLKTERSLRHALKMRAVGELTGGIAHDFNNILGAIMGNLELLKLSVGEDETLQHRLDVALKGTERGAALTRKLLNFSRGQPEQLENVDLNATIHKLQELMVRSLTPAIRVITNLQEAVWPVELNAGEAEDMIMNLIINARDAMPDGGIITLETRNTLVDAAFTSLHPEVQPGEYVQFDISDSGVGIPKEYQERIFDPFFSTKKASKGTGLGLSMVYAFISRHGGHILLYSDPGYGTSFHIYLPRSRHAVEALNAPATQDMQTIERGDETILVVDDEESLAELAKDTLQGFGYTILQASSAEAALQRLTDGTEKIDLVFTDVIMPGSFDGCELAGLISKYWPEVRVLLTSGYTGKRDREDPLIKRCLRQRLLTKPYSRQQLAQAVRRVLDAPPRSDEDESIVED